MFAEVKQRLTQAVTDYANLGYAYTVNKHIEAFFTDREGNEYILRFASLSDVEVWAESCQRNPKLIPALFTKRMVK